MTSLSDLSTVAWALRQSYEKLETVQYGRAWTREEVALGFVGDVGDLMKLVQAAEGVRVVDQSRAQLAHELSDCLWSVLVLAKLYEVDLETSFLETMTALQDRIQKRLGSCG